MSFDLHKVHKMSISDERIVMKTKFPFANFFPLPKPIVVLSLDFFPVLCPSSSFRLTTSCSHEVARKDWHSLGPHLQGISGRS